MLLRICNKGSAEDQEKDRSRRRVKQQVSQVTLNSSSPAGPSISNGGGSAGQDPAGGRDAVAAEH